MDIERIEKLFNVKVTNVEEIKGKAFPLFDLSEVRGLRLVLIKNPMFVVVDNDDVYEKKIEGEYVVVQKDNETYLLLRYEGEPNIEALRGGIVENPKTEEVEREDEDEEQAADEEVNKEDNGEQDGNEDPVKEILRKLPNWADGALVMEKDGGFIVLPIKRSKKGGYYASTTWRPLDVSGRLEDLIIITKSGKTSKVNVYVRDKYVNIYTNRRYSGRRRR